MRFLLKSIVSLLCLAPSVGVCGALIDANVFYFSDAFAYSEETTTFNRTMWDFFIGMGLNKKNAYVLGWNYDSMSFDDNPGTATKLTVTDMGPKFLAYLNKERTWVIGFTYNLITKGKYTEGSAAAVELRGSAMKVEVGYTPEVSEGILIGAKLNYYKASFNETVVNESITKATNGRTVIYPTLSFTVRWD